MYVLLWLPPETFAAVSPAFCATSLNSATCVAPPWAGAAVLVHIEAETTCQITNRTQPMRVYTDALLLALLYRYKSQIRFDTQVRGDNLNVVGRIREGTDRTGF